LDRAVKLIKCALVQALRLCTGRTAHRGSRGIALLFLDHGTRRGRGSKFDIGDLFEIFAEKSEVSLKSDRNENFLA